MRSTTADHIGTYVVDEEVNTLSLTYKSGYTRYEILGLNCPINCELLIKQGAYWYAQVHDEEAVEHYLKENELEFIKNENYVRVSWMNQQRTPVELTFYVDALKLEDTLNFLHYNLI